MVSLLYLTRLQAWEDGLLRRLEMTLQSLDSNRVHALKEVAAASALAAFMIALGAVAAGASVNGVSNQAWRAQQIASIARGDISNIGLMRLATDMDPATLQIVRRYDPALQKPQPAGMWVEAKGGSYDAPPDFQLRDLTPQQAMLSNAQMPFSILPNPAARPFALKVSDPAEEAHALQCMTAAIYYEAASESDAGEAAVAQVVLNRVRHPLFPKTVCGVVFQGAQKTTGCQFTFTCDGSLNRAPSAGGWARAQGIAAKALHGYVFAPVGEATHYHAEYVVPYWSTTLVKLTQVGAHIFYRWNGSGGLPGAFASPYAGGEGEAWAMAEAKLVRVNGPVVIAPQSLQVQSDAPVMLQAAPMQLAEASPTATLLKPAQLATATITMQPQVFQTTTLHDERPQPRIPVPSNW